MQRAHRLLGAALAGWLALGAGADLAPRVPADMFEAMRSVASPLPASAANLARGRDLYLGKGFCAICHGRDGRGLGNDVDVARLRGALPRDLTDPDWQRARSDGELFWVLRHGSPGTAMAAFVPQVLSEDEAWLVVLHVRALAAAGP